MILGVIFFRDKLYDSQFIPIPAVIVIDIFSKEDIGKLTEIHVRFRDNDENLVRRYLTIYKFLEGKDFDIKGHIRKTLIGHSITETVINPYKTPIVIKIFDKNNKLLEL